MMAVGEKSRPTKKVTSVPKVMRQGNAIRGSHSGRGKGGRPQSFSRSEGKPERIATAMKPAAMAIRFPLSDPRVVVSAPKRNTPRSDP